jgi:hypothetical protein
VARYVKGDDNTSINVLEAGFNNFRVMSFKMCKRIAKNVDGLVL